MEQSTVRKHFEVITDYIDVSKPQSAPIPARKRVAQLCKELAVTDRTLKRYREIAIYRIPDYLNLYDEQGNRILLDPETGKLIDPCTFDDFQVYVLRSIRRLFDEYNDARLVKSQLDTLAQNYLTRDYYYGTHADRNS